MYFVFGNWEKYVEEKKDIFYVINEFDNKEIQKIEYKAKEDSSIFNVLVAGMHISIKSQMILNDKSKKLLEENLGERFIEI